MNVTVHLNIKDGGRQISLEDRNLSKTIADSILRLFIVEQPSDLHEFHEFINKM
ncbi:MAG: hypothetical protein ACXVHN_06855 [Methanobacterium sp.]